MPFKDSTTGKETYGAGRYLDIPRQDDDNYIIDFNLAYNPTCAFSPRYNCPYPPPQNTLKIPIEAGEKSPSSTSNSALIGPRPFNKNATTTAREVQECPLPG